MVYRDLNNNGVQDVGEPGVGGVTVRLYAPGPDGILGTPDDVLLATQTTDGSGNTTFYNLTPGIYRVSETVPAGYTNTTPTDVGVSVSAGGTVASSSASTSRRRPSPRRRPRRRRARRPCPPSPGRSSMTSTATASRTWASWG
ncbi:MAG: hypothetical protein KIT87_05715 [Anaerolineae bacterium]|nr:hypothetical protein [Anaerolineae bacterium]